MRALASNSEGSSCIAELIDTSHWLRAGYHHNIRPAQSAGAMQAAEYFKWQSSLHSEARVLSSVQDGF